MAITSYTRLQEAVADALQRADLATLIPTYITLAEARFNRTLRVADMEAFADGTSTDGELELPGDFLGHRRVAAPPYGPLEHVAPAWGEAWNPSDAAGIPAFFSIRGLTLTTYPIYTGTIELDYYARIPALSDDATTNWLLDSHPDLYLAATIAEAYAFEPGEEARAAAWANRSAGIMAEIARLDGPRRFARISTRISSVTP